MISHCRDVSSNDRLYLNMSFMHIMPGSPNVPLQIGHIQVTNLSFEITMELLIYSLINQSLLDSFAPTGSWRQIRAPKSTSYGESVGTPTRIVLPTSCIQSTNPITTCYVGNGTCQLTRSKQNTTLHTQSMSTEQKRDDAIRYLVGTGIRSSVLSSV